MLFIFFQGLLLRINQSKGMLQKKLNITLKEALESVMCDVRRIHLKRWIATRSWIGNQLLYNKTAVERAANFKAKITKFQVEFYFISYPSFLYVFLWRHTWHFPALLLSQTKNLSIILNKIGSVIFLSNIDSLESQTHHIIFTFSQLIFNSLKSNLIFQ